MNFINTFGFEIFSDHLNKIDITNKKSLLSTISPNSYGLSTKDEVFCKALKRSDYLVLDGVYFALGYFLKTGKKVVRNQGPFVADFFLTKANNENLKVFFMGSSDDTLKKIQNNLCLKYPKLELSFYSPPFKDQFSQKENDDILKVINDFKPDILFVGMTCPKQEKWSYSMKSNLEVKLICNIGAVFDWIAGNQSEIHPIWWKLRLAWLKRTIDRPEILKRYPDIGIYFWHLILTLLRIKKYN